MSVEAIGGPPPPSASPQAADKPKENDKITVRAEQCYKKNCKGKPVQVSGNCSSSAVFKPAPKAGENGYLLNEIV